MKAYRLLIALLLLALLQGCAKDEPVLPDGNLIYNNSFEFNGIPAFDGWTGNLYSFAEDAPDNGGRWSLQLEPAWLPAEGYAETYLMGYQGNFSLKFSCNAKSFYGWPGKVILLLEDENGHRIILKQIDLNFPEWSNVTAMIDVNLQKNDKLIIHLSAGSTEIATGKVLFDNIFLGKN